MRSSVSSRNPDVGAHGFGLRVEAVMAHEPIVKVKWHGEPVRHSAVRETELPQRREVRGLDSDACSSQKTIIVIERTDTTHG